jgi:hypothetical protein
MARCDAQHLGRVSPPVQDTSNVAGPENAGPDAGVRAPSDTHVGAGSVETADAGARAPSDTHVGAKSVEVAEDAISPGSVDHAKPTFFDGAPGSSGEDARIAARCADQPALQSGGAPSQDPRSQDRPPRARQDVPPAVRRAVLRRDGGRCVVPGCRHRDF